METVATPVSKFNLILQINQMGLFIKQSSSCYKNSQKREFIIKPCRINKLPTHLT